MGTLQQDLRFACRMLLKNPGFTTVAVLMLALGIGANTAMFSIVNGLLLKPLPYPDPDRLVTIWERNPRLGIEQERVSGPNYLDWQRQNKVFSSVAIGPDWEGSSEFNLALRDSTVKVHGKYVSASFFSTLGRNPLFGRTFFPEEDRKGSRGVAVLGYGLWQRYFGGDRNVIGRMLAVDTYGRREYMVVGVMPPGFGVPSQAELWLPLGWMGVTLDERRSGHWHEVTARLKPGVSIARAQNEMNVIQARIRQAYPNETIGSEVLVIPLLDQALGRNLRRGLMVLWAVVGGVLLIACGNLANLLLARAAVRQKETAIRFALGAGRWRLVRQFLIESIVLGMAGGALGALAGWWGLRLFVAISPGNIPRLEELAIDGAALGFTLGISALTGVLFGLAPALHFSRPDLNQSLKEGSRDASPGRAAGATRNALVVAEIAVSMVLLTGAGLMLQSFARMLHAERGFQSEHLLTADLDFSVSGFTTWVRPSASRPQTSLLELIGRLRALPGVQSVGASSRLLRRENSPPREVISIYGRPSPLKQEEQLKAEFQGITPDWVRALGARVLRGRDISERDTLEAPGAVLINETLARRYFGNENPVGQHIRMGNTQPPLGATNHWGLSEWSEVVGVVSDIKSLHPTPEVVPEVYQSYWQYPMQTPSLLIRTAGDPARWAEVIQRETKSTIPNLPPPVVRTMDELVADTVAQPRLEAELVSLFGGVALLLAAVGLYGVLAVAVSQRRREMGIRLALGASKNSVLRLVLGQGMKLAIAGLAIGIAGAMSLTRVLRVFLYGVRPMDPLTFGVVSLVLGAIALLACWVPAVRAARVDPIEALRCE